MQTSILKKLLREFILISALGGTVVLFFFANPITVYEKGGLSLLWAYVWRGGLATAILWMGNGYISTLPDRWYTWTEAPVKRLAIAVFITVVYTCLAWIFIEWLVFTNRYGWNLPALLREITFRDFIPPLLITFFISIFLHGRSFLIGWKETLIEAERLKKEHISARYETLKNQINPHFLFNSLNVLTSLVHKDADLADRFIRRLSTVYRYILESRDKEVVDLEEELEILRAYLFLMDTRFGASLQADIRVQEPAKGQIAPLTLQMLVENALKHNEVSKAKPLQVAVFQENGYLVVQNNLQPKNALPESTGLGLANIQARYEVLSNKKVLIQQTDHAFTVKVPIL